MTYNILCINLRAEIQNGLINSKDFVQSEFVIYYYSVARVQKKKYYK